MNPAPDSLPDSPSAPVATGRPDTLGAPTLCAAFQLTARRWAEQPALTAYGSERIWSWAEYADIVRRRAAGLAALGVRHGDTVGFLLSNRPAFNLTDSAAMHLGAICWSIYPTSSPEQLEYMLGNARSRVVVTETALLDRLLAVRGCAWFPEQVILVDGPAREDALPVETLETLCPEGFDFEATWRAVHPEDVLSLIYSSGTTGPPKGVELTQHNMMSQLRAMDQVYPISPGGRCISFLPTAHVADRWSTHYNSMIYGLTVHCLSDPRQLFACSARVRPTMWGGVPRVWEKLRGAVEAALAAEPDAGRRETARAAMETGRARLRARRAGHVPEDLERRWQQADEAVFAPLRALLGLDLTEACVVGAAPTPREVVDFFGAVGVEIAEMWGLTECSSNGAINPPGAIRPGTVGKPLPGVEIRLAGDGEILVRGPVVMKGYRDDPVRTAEAIDPEGWLHTGDVGEFDEAGYLRIVDRKKDLIINSSGKNMSPANIEAAIKGAGPLIGHAVVIGDARPYNVALVVPDPDAAGGRAHDDSGLVREILDAVARGNQRLARVEQVKRVHVVAGEWAPGGEFLTQTSKVRREPVARHFGPEITALYAGGGEPVPGPEALAGERPGGN